MDEAAVLADLSAGLHYEAIAKRHNISRGRVYRTAVKHGARKNERRIQERAQQTKQRRRAFLEEVINSTVKCDVLDFLDSLPSESVDLWVTSPPYAVGKDYERDMGSFALTHYLGWLLQVTAEMARCLSSTGVMCLQVGATRMPNGQPYPIDGLIMEHLRAMGLHFQTRIAWPSDHGLTPKHRLAERYETVLVYSKSPAHAFNPTPARKPQKHPGKRAYKGPNKGKLSGHPLGAFPNNVWDDIPQVKHNSKDRRACGDHPAPFPTLLAKRLILLYSLPGDLVGDPFCGTGTSCVGAKETGRAFIGADIMYEDLRAKRLEAVEPDLVSMLPGVTDESVAIWQAEAVARQFEAEPISEDELEEQHQLCFDDASAPIDSSALGAANCGTAYP